MCLGLEIACTHHVSRAANRPCRTVSRACVPSAALAESTETIWGFAVGYVYGLGQIVSVSLGRHRWSSSVPTRYAAFTSLVPEGYLGGSVAVAPPSRRGYEVLQRDISRGTLSADQQRPLGPWLVSDSVRLEAAPRKSAATSNSCLLDGLEYQHRSGEVRSLRASGKSLSS